MKKRTIIVTVATLFMLVFISIGVLHVREVMQWENRLYVPTMIQKLDDTYFIVDCWNHRVLYNECLDKNIKEWSTLTDEGYIAGHTIASDGEVFLLDNTDASEMLVYKKNENGIFEKTQTIAGILGRPHYTLYDAERDRFLVIGSVCGKIYEFKNINGVVDWTNTMKLEEIEGSYVRSISIIEGKLYTVSGPNAICVYDILEDGFRFDCSYEVPQKYSGMNGIQKIGDYFYLTVNTDSEGNVEAATILRTKNLENVKNDKVEDIKKLLKFKTQPYYITCFDNHYYCTQISAEGENGVVQFDIENDVIKNISKLWEFDTESSSVDRYAVRSSSNSQIVDLLLFAGQSNMAGHGNAVEAPNVVQGYEFKAISDPTTLYSITEPFGIFENVEGGINDTRENMTVFRKSGSMVSAFANAYLEKTGVPIVAVSCSEGATVLDEWLPGQVRYEDMLNRYKSAYRYLVENEDYTVRKIYFVWCQGESDGDAGTSCEEYEKKMEVLYDDLLKSGIDAMLVVRIGNFAADSTKYDEIIKAQTEFCHKNDKAVLISTRFAEMAETGLMIDDYHYQQEGYNLVGEEAGTNAGYYADTGFEPNLYDYEYKEEYRGHDS